MRGTHLDDTHVCNLGLQLLNQPLLFLHQPVCLHRVRVRVIASTIKGLRTVLREWHFAWHAIRTHAKRQAVSKILAVSKQVFSTRATFQPHLIQLLSRLGVISIEPMLVILELGDALHDIAHVVSTRQSATAGAATRGALTRQRE